MASIVLEFYQIYEEMRCMFRMFLAGTLNSSKFGRIIENFWVVYCESCLKYHTFHFEISTQRCHRPRKFVIFKLLPILSFPLFFGNWHQVACLILLQNG